jgi:hypothetical protein
MRIRIRGESVEGGFINIFNARLDSGELVPADEAPVELIPITAQGVDGREFLEVGKRPTPLVFTTYRPTNDMAKMERNSAKTVGRLVLLEVVPGELNQFLIFKDALVTSVRTVGRTGKLHGLGSTTENYTLIQQWCFEL